MNPFSLYSKQVWQSGDGFCVRKNESPGKIFIIMYVSHKKGFIYATVLLLKAELKLGTQEINCQETSLWVLAHNICPTEKVYECRKMEEMCDHMLKTETAVLEKWC